MNHIKSYLQIASFFHKDFERMAETAVSISPFGRRIYDIKGEAFSARVEAEELEPLCSNKRIQGKVIQTIGQSPIVMGDRVHMVFLERGETRVKLDLSSMSPEVLVKRFLREGELNEADRIISKKERSLKFGLIFGFIIVAVASILAGAYDTWTPIVVVILYVVLMVEIDKSHEKQLKEVLD